MHRGKARANMFTTTCKEVTNFKPFMALDNRNADFYVSIFELHSICFKT